ncbi:hypothetical protein GQ43DRAFT_380525 [Delitschia confertaspora ATCC 74209]|uniref:F-box domain-containing protein n=1 Tax=Delitschia confertaspora ATCC 74209 TaxID=1513339 RepID=A0A9P4JGN2_9PLEO|nr:hypothetical protein GQ43DRAFT_380525 [Delitschia confertaspora ATCC 74209]
MPPAHPATPLTVPQHSFFTSPVQAHNGQKELPLHLVALIISYIDHAADLARLTRTSRLFYYMALPKLYENVTLRSYSDIRYVNGRPEGYGNGSPFAMGLNTLISRPFAEYIYKFRVAGEWREHDTDDYSKGRVPDNTMMLSVALRAALDKMKKLEAFAWELNTKPMQTVYQGIIARPNLTSLILRQPTKRIPRPTVLIPPLPNLTTLVVYDIDPLCYPDDISILLLTSKKLENLKLHWNPRMREMGEESVNLMNYFGRCLTAKHKIPIKRFAFYNLYTRNNGEGFEDCLDPRCAEEITIINSMGSSDPMTVFLDDTWRIKPAKNVPGKLKMMRGDMVNSDHVKMLARITSLERLYLLGSKPLSKPSSTAVTPTSAPGFAPNTIATPTEQQCKSLASDYLAVIQSNHHGMRHLLLSDTWMLGDEAILQLCKACPNLEQLGVSCCIAPPDNLRKMVALVPRLWALRILIRPASEFGEMLTSMDIEMHRFALATELWKPEYRNLKYFGLGDSIVFKLGHVVGSTTANGVGRGGDNSLNAKRRGPFRVLETVERESVEWIEIWGLDNTEFDTSFP